MEAIQAGHKYNERVEAVLGRSRRAEGLVAAAALATALLLAALPLAIEWRAAGLAWIAGSAVCALRRLRPGARLCVDHEGAIAVGSGVGSIAPGSFVAPWLTIVRWLPKGKRLRQTLLVMPDALRAEDHRRLRVLLRYAREK